MTARSIPADRHCFDRAEDLAGLMKTIEVALDANLAFIDQLPAGLLEREALVFLAGAKRRGPLDLSFEESVPGAVEPIRDGLYRLRVDQLPMRKAAVAEFGQMFLQLVLVERFAEQLVVAPVKRDRVIPDMCGHIDGAVQVFGVLRSHELESEFLPHLLEHS